LQGLDVLHTNMAQCIRVVGAHPEAAFGVLGLVFA
jgi:hypothetical protein